MARNEPLQGESANQTAGERPKTAFLLSKSDFLCYLGAFSSPEDVALMDDAMELVMSDRQRYNAEMPRVEKFSQ